MERAIYLWRRKYKMRQTIERIWTLLNVTVEKLQEQDNGIVLNRESYKRFNDIFRDLHKEIKDRYMEKSVKNLDRHKIAGIAIISIIRSDAITYQGKVDEDKEFFGQYLIAMSVGITFMQNQLNTLLFRKKVQPIKTICFPEPLSCDTPYFEILCRNLYFANNNRDWGLNPLELAEKLFLLEYMTLEKNGIDPRILKV